MGGPATPGGTGSSDRRRRLLGPTIAALLVVGVGMAAVVASPPAEAPAEGDATASAGETDVGGGLLADEVTLPDDDGPGGGDDGPGTDGIGAEAFADGEGADFECLLASGCGWRVDVSDLGAATNAIQPAGDDTLLVTGTAGVAVLDLDGRRRWSQPWGSAGREEPLTRPAEAVDTDEGTEPRTSVDAQVAAAVAAGPLVLTSTSERLVGYAAGSGRRRWSASGPADPRLHVHSRATASGTTVLAAYAGSGSGNEQGLPSLVRAHSAHHGGPQWEARADAIAVGEEVVVLIDDELTGIDAETGERLWRRSFDDLASGPANGAAPMVTFAGPDRLLLLPHPLGAGGTELLDAATGEVTYTTDEADLVWARDEGGDTDGTRIVVQLPGASPELMGIDAGGVPTWHRVEGLDHRCCEPLPSTEVVALTGLDDGGALLVDPDDGRVLFDREHPEGAVLFALGRDIVVVAHAPSGTDLAIDHRDDRMLWRTRESFPQLDVPGYGIHRLDDEVVGIPVDPGGGS